MDHHVSMMDFFPNIIKQGRLLYIRCITHFNIILNSNHFIMYFIFYFVIIKKILFYFFFYYFSILLLYLKTTTILTIQILKIYQICFIRSNLHKILNEKVTYAWIIFLWQYQYVYTNMHFVFIIVYSLSILHSSLKLATAKRCWFLVNIIMHLN